MTSWITQRVLSFSPLQRIYLVRQQESKTKSCLLHAVLLHGWGSNEQEGLCADLWPAA